MGATFENLRVLQSADEIADGIWEVVIRWTPFARDVVGTQLARAADSIGANIAESFGRFHFGEKLQFLYYARGSLFETKYWLNRALKRQLMNVEQGQTYATRLTSLARQLNAFANGLKDQRKISSKQPNSIREISEEYVINKPLFDEADLEWLQIIPSN
jgi:four helix bundle protein